MYDNRNLISKFEETNYVSLSVYLNFLYANMYEYDFQFFTFPQGESKDQIMCYITVDGFRYGRSSPWCKLLVLYWIFSQKLIQYEFILWMDSDAIFADSTRSLFHFLQNAEYHFGNSHYIFGNHCYYRRNTPKYN